MIDRSIALAGEGLVDEPIRLTFERGRIVAVEGGRAAEAARTAIAEAGEGADVVAELGIGTNERARITGSIITDEKVLGTAHVAFGDNASASYGGDNRAAIHVDGVMADATIEADGVVVMASACSSDVGRLSVRAGEQRDGLAGRALAAAREAEAVRAGRAHRDAPDVAQQRLRDVRAHRVAVGRELRLLQHDERVHVDELQPVPAMRRHASASRSRLRAPAQRSSLEGNIVPMSSRHAAPSSASQSAWQTMSASECPSRPCVCGILTPPSTSGRPGDEAVRVEGRADAELSQAAPRAARGR